MIVDDFVDIHSRMLGDLKQNRKIAEKVEETTLYRPLSVREILADNYKAYLRQLDMRGQKNE